jgi:para-aminobenzoate synthetase / 4-amino-4-deoxychorismate lyase
MRHSPAKGANVIATDQPFVLLDDARADGAAPARLYRNPRDVIIARSIAEVGAALRQLAGGHIAGFLSYEAGLAFEPRLRREAASAMLPLAWFGVFDGYEEIASDAVASLLPDPEGGWLGAPVPQISRAAYGTALSGVKAYIAAGDVYQANLTFPNAVATAGHPLTLYAGLRARAKAGYGGVIWTGEDWLLSLSPELFFALHDGKITTKPMKGTAARAHHDAAAVEILRNDPKQRAENLMIVDLLRNDLSRVAEPGSVEVPQLFHVETYPTVYQMTSTVTAHLRQGLGAADMLAAIYPCGSITGAPKIRAMEIIDEVEAGPRGAYTGSIGRMDPNGDAAFNVAIRTLHIKAGESCATLGLGSGIVSDSRVDEEWSECLAKGKFVADLRNFDLIETMRFDPAGGIHLLERHIARIGESARTFGISFDRHAVRNELQAATFRISAPRRVRLMLSMSGSIAIEITKLHPAPDGPVEIALAPLPVVSTDFRLRHKTSDRAFYREVREKAGTFDVALVDPDGFVTEGSFTNIFVKGDGALLTPPLSRGLLPGVLRAELLANGSAVEADLRPEDLDAGFFVGNASRGLIEARLADRIR